MSVLKATGWFQNFTDEQLREIASFGRIKRIADKKLLFVQGEPLTDYFFVVDGLVHAYHQNKEGKRWIASLFASGDLFPHVGLADDESHYPANGGTITPCLLLVISRTNMQKLMLRYPVLERRLTEFLAKKSRELMNRYASGSGKFPSGSVRPMSVCLLQSKTGQTENTLLGVQRILALLQAT